MPRRIVITEYPVEYVPFNPVENACFYAQPITEELPDSGVASLHYHSSYQIGVCLSGNGVFLIENELYPVKKGDAVIISPDTIHCSKSNKNSKCVWQFVYFYPYEMKKSLSELPLPSSRLYTEDGNEEINRLIKKIISEAGLYFNNSDTLASLYFYSLSLLASRKYPDGETIREEEQIRDDDSYDMYNILPSLKEIAFRFDESLKVGELAKKCMLSESHFNRIFKKCLGMSPYTYTLKFRVKVGVSLLESTDMSVGAVSETVGFGNISDFYRQFIKEYSCSPTDFRAMLAQKKQ